jgi:hypothetical protein
MPSSATQSAIVRHWALEKELSILLGSPSDLAVRPQISLELPEAPRVSLGRREPTEVAEVSFIHGDWNSPLTGLLDQPLAGYRLDRFRNKMLP